MMYRIALSRDPNPRELASNVEFLQKQREQEAVGATFEGKSAEILALTELGSRSVESDEFVYIR